MIWSNLCVPLILLLGVYLLITFTGAQGLKKAVWDIPDPIEKLSRPASDARFHAAMRWAEKHGYELHGCLKCQEIGLETAIWGSFGESSALTYMNVPDGTGGLTGHCAFESLFEGEMALVTLTNKDDLIVPMPPGIYQQAFPQLRPHPGGDRERNWVEAAQNAPNSIAAAEIELEGLWREHCASARFLLEQGAVFDEGVKWDLEYGWEPTGDGLGMEESFQKAIDQRDFPLLLRWNIRSRSVLTRYVYDYIRSHFFWYLRIGFWYFTRPKKWMNHTIEEQCARRWVPLPKNVVRRHTLTEAAKKVYGNSWEPGKKI